MRKILLILTFIFSLSFFSCGNGEYEQYYANYSDFKKITNKRLTGWFPEIITRDSYEIKNTSYLDICAFSSIKYKKALTLDSIFKSYKPITVQEFEKAVEKHQSKVPEWFVSKDSINSENYEAIELNDKLFALKKKTENRIYTISAIKD